MALDAHAARQAIERQVGGPLGLSCEAAARGVLAIVDNNMVGALRVVSVERGHDPRDFTLVPFGGAGPLHGCALADLLGITRMLVPPAPGVLCADGLLAADLKADFSRTLPKAGAVDLDVARETYAGLERQADDWLAAEKVPVGDRRKTRIALMRYHGQGGEVAVAWVDDKTDAEAAFAAAHEGLYGFKLDAAIELVTLRVEAIGRRPAPPRAVLAAGSGAKPQRRLAVHFVSGTTDIPLFDRATLGAGDRLAGPAIISQLDATTLVPEGWAGEVHSSGAILLTRR
jgi:N-methylhydantoinase A